MVFNYVWKNAEHIFKKAPPNQGMLKDLHCPLVKINGAYDQLIKLKVNSTALCWTINGNMATKSSVNDITPQSHCVPIVCIERIWTMPNGKFGVTAVVRALMIYPRMEKTIEDVFNVSGMCTE